MFNYDDYESSSDSEETNASSKSSSSSELEIIYKKRGPKKRINKRQTPVSFKLKDSFSSSNDESDIEKNNDETDINDKNIVTTLNQPWIEKYRPSKIEDLVLDTNTYNNIKKMIDDKIMPNIIITGMPGVGKTSTILCIAKNILGESYKDNILELNASDERGVKTVQIRMENFCKIKSSMSSQESKHKLVLLDEADNMTKKAQQSISILIDKYKNTTRFAFTCNNSSDIIQAIQSRCIIFRYIRLNNLQIKTKLINICNIEKVDYTQEGLDAIVSTSQGDLRQAIGILQLTHNGYTKIIPENVYKLCDKPPPMIIQNIFIACKKKDVRTALLYLNDLYNKGYSSSDIALSMHNTLKNIPNNIIDEETKITYMMHISDVCFIINKGVNTPLQLNGTIAALCYNLNI